VIGITEIEKFQENEIQREKIEIFSLTINRDWREGKSATDEHILPR
jgi:hypothetical protein